MLTSRLFLYVVQSSQEDDVFGVSLWTWLLTGLAFFSGCSLLWWVFRSTLVKGSAARQFLERFSYSLIVVPLAIISYILMWNSYNPITHKNDFWAGLFFLITTPLAIGYVVATLNKLPAGIEIGTELLTKQLRGVLRKWQKNKTSTNPIEPQLDPDRLVQPQLLEVHSWPEIETLNIGNLSQTEKKVEKAKKPVLSGSSWPGLPDQRSEPQPAQLRRRLQRKINPEVEAWLVSQCQENPRIATRTLQQHLKEQFGITISEGYLSEVRTSLGIRRVRQVGVETDSKSS